MDLTQFFQKITFIYLPTLHTSFVRREDAGISTGGGADVQVKLDILLQSEALSVVTSGEDGFMVLLLMVTGDTNVSLYHIECYSADM